MLQIPPACDLTLGLTRVASPDGSGSVWRARIDERFLNPAGTLQGGFLAAIADSAMGAAAVSAVGERKVFVANTDLRISFLRPVPEGSTLTCTATVVKAGSLVRLRRGDHRRPGCVARRDRQFHVRHSRPH